MNLKRLNFCAHCGGCARVVQYRDTQLVVTIECEDCFIGLRIGRTPEVAEATWNRRMHPYFAGIQGDLAWACSALAKSGWLDDATRKGLDEIRERWGCDGVG